MELTGKAKEAFKKWFSTGLPEQIGFSEIKILRSSQYRMGVFNQLSPSMQYGVYVDFFDSVGIIVTIAPYHTNHLSEGIDTDGTFSIFIHDKNGNWIYDGVDFESKPEARTAAITKANDLFNER